MSRTGNDGGDADLIDITPAETNSRWRFTPQETWLLDHIRNHKEKDVVVSTTADKKIKLRRLKLWNEIHSQFVKSGVAERQWSLDQLLIWWKNTRASSKKTTGIHKASIRQTGGGPAPHSLPAEVDEVMALVGDFAKPLDNPHDSDASFFSKEEVVPPDKWSIGKQSEGEVKSAARSVITKPLKRTIMPAENGNDMRQRENELIVKKLALEIEVLEKKSRYMDWKLTKTSAGRNETHQAFMPSTPSAQTDYNPLQPRGLFNTPTSALMSSTMTTFNYEDE